MIRGSWQPTAVHTQRSLEEQPLTGLRRLEAIERGPLGKPDIRLRFGHRGASEVVAIYGDGKSKVSHAN